MREVSKRSSLIGSNRFSDLRPTPVYEAYWRFAAERQEIMFRRIEGVPGPWTEDPILRQYRFTNAYRAADRVSQYLIRHVVYGDGLPFSPAEVLFRVLLFKIFNKIETWQVLTSQLQIIEFASFDITRYDRILTQIMANGGKTYSGAYIMPPVQLPETGGVKHRGHLLLLDMMMRSGIVERVVQSHSLRELFSILLAFPSIGPFLGYQLAIDLNYSMIVNHEESEFVVAGPGALDGISKCFDNSEAFDPADIIQLMCDRQEDEFHRLGLRFRSLGDRPLQLIDCQNLFCEVSKYSRVSHPEYAGVAGRKRIKQTFREKGELEPLFFPPKWNLSISAGTD